MPLEFFFFNLANQDSTVVRKGSYLSEIKKLKCTCTHIFNHNVVMLNQSMWLLSSKKSTKLRAIHTHTHTHTQSHIHMYMHTYTHIHAHIVVNWGAQDSTDLLVVDFWSSLAYFMTTHTLPVQTKTLVATNTHTHTHTHTHTQITNTRTIPQFQEVLQPYYYTHATQCCRDICDRSFLSCSPPCTVIRRDGRSPL